MDTLAALEQQWAACFDLEAQVAFFPVRHHSPACALHLGRVLEQYRPQAILVEGPADTCGLIPHIGAPDNTAPICIYYSCTHKETVEGETVEHRSGCYYPLLDFSPELTAIRYGVAQGVDTRFIDLPYSQLSLLERQRREKGEGGKASYYDDYYLSRSDFIQRLCQKENCRHYGELWEKLFELGGLDMDTPGFVRAMLALCHYSRVEYTPEMLEWEGSAQREAYMAAEIRKAMGEYNRILVVTGGFHTAALAGLIRSEVTVPKVTAARAQSYLIPYSFAESDQLAGYASGMPYPAFYQAVWERLGDASSDPYGQTVLEYLVRVGGALRRKKETTSIADEAAAVRQAGGLARLRDKPAQGVYELLDAVRSAYVKGAMDGAAAMTMDTAAELLRGNRMGKVTSGAEQVPLLLDFRATAKGLRLKTDNTIRQEVTLDLLTKPAHRVASAFFHRLDFLGAGFGERKFGPDYRQRDTGRVREKWQYVYSARVEANLIDVSYLGATMGEAASTALARKKLDYTGCGELSRLIIDAAVMDLTEHIAPLLEATRAAIAADGSFDSLVEAARNLLFLESAKWLLSLKDIGFAGELLGQVFTKAVALLPSLATNQEDEDRELAASLKNLNQIASRAPDLSALLDEALWELCDRETPPPPPCLQGAAAGLLYARQQADADKVLDYAGAYLYGSGQQMKKSGLFLSGVFLLAWDILFASAGFLEGLSHVLATLPQEDFLTLLPDLRLAFSTFTPTQIDRTGAAVAALLGASREEVEAPAVDEELLALGRELDKYVADKLEVVG